MPVVAIKTYIPLEEYERFKRKAQELRVSEYALAQEFILTGLNEPEKHVQRKLLKLVADFFIEDLKHTH